MYEHYNYNGKIILPKNFDIKQYMKKYKIDEIIYVNINTFINDMCEKKTSKNNINNIIHDIIKSIIKNINQ